MDCENILETGAEEMRITIGQEEIALLCRYAAELIKWNRKINLVGHAPLEEILETHFLDSLALAALLRRHNADNLLDIGSGAGFPGLVIKCHLPSLPVTLVEPRQKRAAFLRHIIRTLQLHDITVIEKRMPEAAMTKEGGAALSFQTITSRALNTVAEFLEMTAPFSPSDGTVICMKGPKAAEEIATWRSRNDPSYELSGVHPYELPFSAAKRSLLVFARRK